MKINKETGAVVIETVADALKIIRQIKKQIEKATGDKLTCIV